MCEELEVCNQCDKVRRHNVSPQLTEPSTLTPQASMQMCDDEKMN